MPELPEVETVRRGIAPVLQNAIVEEVVVRERRMRLPVPKNFRQRLKGRRIITIGRRGKYLTFQLDDGGAVIAHLGMSGAFYFSETPPREKHEHVGFQINGRFLIYHDPRRFGGFALFEGEPENHPLLCEIGPEPLSAKFNGKCLFEALHKRHSPIKTAVMDGKVVAGVGNIYASESLYLAKIRPQTSAARLSVVRMSALAAAIKDVLRRAIRAGGSSMRDFYHPDNSPGYFQTKWKVYGRKGESCQCGGVIRKIVQSNRATYYCPRCQR